MYKNKSGAIDMAWPGLRWLLDESNRNQLTLTYVIVVIRNMDSIGNALFICHFFIRLVGFILLENQFQIIIFIESILMR